MNWLQNTIAVIIGFLIARVMIDSGVHRSFVRYLLVKSQSSLSFFVTGILFTSYFFSLFFSNTVVVLSMIPIIKLIFDGMEDSGFKKRVSTITVLALIYGANIGGMGSLIGSPLNIMYVGIIEMNQLPGRENITFFSWLAVGIPTTLILLFISRMVLAFGMKGLTMSNSVSISQKTPQNTSQDAIDKKKTMKYTIFFVANISLLVLLTALQFWLKPGPIVIGLNFIDLLMIVYLPAFIFFAFIFPKSSKKKLGDEVTKIKKNIVFLLMYVFLFVPIYLLETLKDISLRFRFRGIVIIRRVDTWLLNQFNRIWFSLFKEKRRNLKAGNEFSYVSLNRLIYDLPFFGLLFMGVVLLAVFFIVNFGDNPATPKLDGYVLRFLEDFSSRLVPAADQVFLFLLVVIMAAIFFTEIVNNTAVVLILFPMVLKACASLPLNPLFALLAVTMAASGAFMTPIATSVNAIAFAGFKGVSLKKMMGLGILLNLLSGLYIAILFYFLGAFTT